MARQNPEAKGPSSGIEMQWVVELHREFDPEFMQLPLSVQQMILAHAELLRKLGPQLGRKQVDTLKGSKHANMKELRFDADDGCWRVAFAFDVKRRAVLLVAGDKSGVSQDKFYRNLIKIADRRFDQHQRAVANEKERK
jgi:hypothetical protein